MTSKELTAPSWLFWRDFDKSYKQTKQNSPGAPSVQASFCAALHWRLVTINHWKLGNGGSQGTDVLASGFIHYHTERISRLQWECCSQGLQGIVRRVEVG